METLDSLLDSSSASVVQPRLALGGSSTPLGSPFKLPCSSNTASPLPILHLVQPLLLAWAC